MYITLYLASNLQSTFGNFDQIYNLSPKMTKSTTTFQALYPQSTTKIVAKSTIYKKGKPPLISYSRFKKMIDAL